MQKLIFKRAGFKWNSKFVLTCLSLQGLVSRPGKTFETKILPTRFVAAGHFTECTVFSKAFETLCLILNVELQPSSERRKCKKASKSYMRKAFKQNEWLRYTSLGFWWVWASTHFSTSPTFSVSLSTLQYIVKHCCLLDYKKIYPVFSPGIRGRIQTDICG